MARVIGHDEQRERRGRGDKEFEGPLASLVLQRAGRRRRDRGPHAHDAGPDSGGDERRLVAALTEHHEHRGREEERVDDVQQRRRRDRGCGSSAAATSPSPAASASRSRRVLSAHELDVGVLEGRLAHRDSSEGYAAEAPQHRGRDVDPRS